MHIVKNRFILGLLGVTILIQAMKEDPTQPTLFLIGDSTVRNGQGDGRNGQWGWGSVLSQYFDTTKISVDNRALGGTSSRTYLTRGLWERVSDDLRPGDFLIIQFGHNDGGPLDDTARARGTLPGTGDEKKEIFNPITKQKEVVHTYGWYLEKYVQEAKAKNVHVMLCSLIPRHIWEEGKTVRSKDSYAQWAEEVASRNEVDFIDLNRLIAERYDQLGEESVAAYFQATDHTHTNLAGAVFNAQIVAEAIGKFPHNDLKHYLLRD